MFDGVPNGPVRTCLEIMFSRERQRARPLSLALAVKQGPFSLAFSVCRMVKKTGPIQHCGFTAGEPTMKRFFKAAWKGVTRRPLTCLLVLVGLAVGSWIGLFYWSDSQFRAAKEAVRLGKYAEAKTHIKRCLALRPWNVEVHLLAARIATLHHDFPEAEAMLRKCKSLQGEMTQPIQIEWSLMDVEAGSLENHYAKLWALASTEDHPQAVDILSTLARALIVRSRLWPALACLHRWLEIDPDSILALEMCGICYASMGSRERAMTNSRRILKLDPKHKIARLSLIELLLISSQNEEALRHAEYLMQTYPDDPAVQVKFASVMQHLNKYERARETLDRVLADRPEDTEALLVRTQVEIDDGNGAAAEPWVRRLVSLSPYDSTGYELLARSLNMQGKNPSEAAEAVERCENLRNDSQRVASLLSGELEKDPNSPVAATDLGRIYLRTGNEKAGLYWLNVALERQRGYAPAHQALLEYYEKTNQSEPAQAHRDFLKANGYYLPPAQLQAQATLLTSAAGLAGGVAGPWQIVWTGESTLKVPPQK
jgi:tetratricopeptide (TPR) repeat protein